MQKNKMQKGIGELNVTVFLKIIIWGGRGVRREAIFHRSVALSINLLERLCFSRVCTLYVPRIVVTRVKTSCFFFV